MNREIKFRGKRIDNGEWVYGFLDFNAVESGFVIHAVADIPPTWQEPGGDIYSEKFAVIPETVGQYINLQDKDGNYVYEGDIVKGPNGKHWIIELIGYSWNITNRLIPTGPMKFAGEETYAIDDWLNLPPKNPAFKIIGNIFDHSELTIKPE